MQIQPEIDGLARTLEQQIALLTELVQHEREMQKAVILKDWNAMQQALDSIQQLSEEIYTCENERVIRFRDLLAVLSLPADTGFSLMTAGLSSQNRLLLDSLYRQLKAVVSQVQNITGGIDAYISSTVTTMNQILEELFPSSRGDVYTRCGNVRGAQAAAVMINHQL
ncbi:flagellar export chaperone FlgN [Spirochaeta dissipatitropha]